MQRHFTATAFVIDSQNRVLLMWHKRLQRWMPPGGHVDENEMPEETARRECKEETGLDIEIVGGPQPDVFANAPAEGRILKLPIGMLLEEIPASPERGEPAHQHMDSIFLGRLVDESQALTLAEAEGKDLRWFSLDEIKALDTDTEIFVNVRDNLVHLLAR